MSRRILQVISAVKKWLSKAYPLWDNKLSASDEYDILVRDREYMGFYSEVQRRILHNAENMSIHVGPNAARVLSSIHENGIPFLNVYEAVLTLLLDVNAPHACFVWVLFYHNDLGEDDFTRLLGRAQQLDAEIRRFPERLPCLTPYLKMRCIRFDYINSPYWEDIQYEGHRRGVI